MRPLPQIALMIVLMLALALGLARPVSAAAAPDRDVPAWAIAPLASVARTGIVYDRVLPLARLERFDGSATAPPIDLATWRQAWDELRRASIGPATGPDLDRLMAGARDRQRSGVIPIALLDRAYERLRPGALEDGSLVVDGGRIARAEPAALIEARAFAATALAPRTYRGGDVTFSLDAERIFADAGPPRAIAIDFADGRGERAVTPGQPVDVHYAETGAHTLRLRATRADGTIATSRFDFEVAALATPTPDDTLHVVATIPYQGQYGTGEAYVYRAPGHASITNPVVAIEGFDTDNSMNWDELYQLLDEQNLIETLRADGFDAVVLNFTDATEAIQTNAFVVEALIEQVRNAIPP